MSDRLPSPLFGLDSTSEVPATAHRAAGSSFALRYLSRYAWKVANPHEIHDYEDNGIGVAVVFEDGVQNALRGYSQGRADAEFAVNQAKSLGMPAGRPIFFAVDLDTSGNPGATDQYFDGVAAVLGQERCGPYGGFEVVRRQFDRGYTWGWQTYAWSGTELDVRAQLYQYSNDHSVGGVRVDFDHAFYEDYGQWNFKSTPPPDPDPHHYLRFPEGPFPFFGKLLHERWLVQEYDRYRMAPHAGANAEMLNLLREDVILARKRVWFEAHLDRATGQRLKEPSWGLYHRGWRWQQLWARSRGQRVV